MGPVAASPRRIDWTRVFLSVAIALGGTLIVIGVLGSRTGRDQSGLPDEIERIQPARGDRVLSQSDIVVDLVDGYGGRLEIDGVAVPTESTQQAEPGGDGSAPVATAVEDPDAARFDAGTNTLSFQPRPGARLDRFEVGRHVVRVLYWKLTEGETRSRSYTWYFDVAA